MGFIEQENDRTPTVMTCCRNDVDDSCIMSESVTSTALISAMDLCLKRKLHEGTL